MKVLLINSVCGFGSTGRIVCDIYDRLVEEGHDCCVAYGRGDAPPEYNSYKIGTKLDLVIHGLKSRLFDKHGFSSKRATNKLVNFIKEFQPDFIHLHNLHGYYLNVEILFSYLKESKAKVFWTMHDCWAFSGHSALIDLDTEGNLNDVITERSELAKYPKSLLLNNSKRNLKVKEDLFLGVNDLTIITPSNWLKSMLEKSFFSKTNILVINNGISLNVFYPKEKKESSDGAKILLGVASVWTEYKGLKYFNELCNLIDSEFEIVIVGKANSSEIDSRITYIERTNNQAQLADLYNTSYCFINPTLEDTFPTTNIESIACGTPVITFDTGGSPEIITSKSGLVTDRKDTDSIFKAISQISKEDITAESCRKDAERYSLVNMMNNYVNLYNEFILKKENLNSLT